jgi:hypothetical protein
MKKRTKPKVQKRADLPFRLGVPSQTYDKIPNKEPFVNKAILNSLVPKFLQHDTMLDNQGFLNMMRSLDSKTRVNYEDGVYFGMPNDPKGE